MVCKHATVHQVPIKEYFRLSGHSLYTQTNAVHIQRT